jgi:Flp pilus assembly CpaE family ATPase
MSNWQSTYRSSVSPQGTSAAGGSNPVNSESSPYLDDQYPDSLGADALSIALIGPDEDRRKAASSALTGCQSGEIREFSSYPASLDDVPKLLEQQYDVIIIDLDSHPEYALELVESICANGASTVMVYSMKTDAELLVRCMRAGAREFLTLPFAQNTMAEALVRASARRPATRPAKKTGGRLLVFLGAKGGDGVTTLACNFAVSMAQESGQSTILIDLDLPLGDAGLNLGVAAEYSTINALQNASRLDSSFLSKLLVKHSSGVSVLAAPGKFPQFPASNDAIDRLVTVARQDFENVVIDMGSRLDLMGTSLFKEGSTIYLVIQAGIAGLRNSNRLISQYFTTGIPKLEIVLNRYEPRSMGVSEDQITKALTRPAQWKIPNDYAAVRRMQSTAVPLALEDSPISRLVHQMARSACGLPATPEKRSGFSLKSLSRSLSSKISAPEEATSFTQLGLTSDNDSPVAPVAAQSEAAASPSRRSQHTAPAAAESAPAEAEERTDLAEAKRGARQSASTPSRQGEPETRSYKGATYVKGADGEWHLQQAAPKIEPIVEPRVEHKVEPRFEPRIEPRVEPRFEPRAVVQEAPAPAVAATQETPVIAWSTPVPIPYGTALSTTQLRAMASVPGKFSYSPSVGEVMSAGIHTLTVDFTPNDSEGYTTAQATVLLTVTRATPSIKWQEPAAILYGTALSAKELNATSLVPGRFVYSPAAGEVLEAGRQTLSVTFTPADTAGYTEAHASVPLTITKATATITWPAPAPIVYGTALSATQLNATASVPGKITYTPAAGEVLTAGTHKLTASFTPTESTNYAAEEATVQLTVTKAKPTIAWPMPSPIIYGTALSATQLNAVASVPGKLAYIPGIGAVLSAGTHTPSVTFTPTDTANYNGAQAAVTLTVTKAPPAIIWPTPAPIVYGTPLSAAQLNATASIPGKFSYSPAVGEVLAAGTQTLSATFTPTDTTDYAAVQTSVSLTVTKAKPTEIAWQTPAPISYGTQLSATQLNATASIPGKFVYSPAAGEVLSTGQHTLSVTFTPTDSNFPAAQGTVTLTVTKAVPTIIWPAPAGISYGTALSATQLNAKASVPGTYAYTPAAGDVLGAGVHTLSVTFTPKDTAEEATAQASVQLTVSKATPIITWQAPAAISYGTMLGTEQLNATALVPGAFFYTPAAGNVLAAGTQTLSVTFVPTDTADYTTAQATVSLVVEGLPNLDSLMPVSTDEDRSGLADAKGGAAQSGSPSNQQSKPETRSYKGATYEKGADGQWYLQKK